MCKKFSEEDKALIGDLIRKRYRDAAGSPGGHFRYPTGKAGLEGLRYPRELLEKLPDDVLESYCGVGNPFSLGPVHEGESVLDIGCGAGVDALFAAVMTGPRGLVVGIDTVPEMIRHALKNQDRAQLRNVHFQEGSGENLLFAEASFDVVISNGAFNLIPDKCTALQEAFRVMKPGGRFMIADQVLTTSPPVDRQAAIQSWAR